MTEQVRKIDNIACTGMCHRMRFLDLQCLYVFWTAGLMNAPVCLIKLVWPYVCMCICMCVCTGDLAFEM